MTRIDQSDLYCRNSAVFKNFVLYSPDPPSAFTEGLGTRLLLCLTSESWSKGDRLTSWVICCGAEGLVTLEGLSHVRPLRHYSCDFHWECLILGQFIRMEDGEVMTA